MKIFNKLKTNKGMSYVELIVVLSIFSVLSSVAIYNYGDFQSKVDIKNLGSDIALKIVEAQKSSLSGLLPVQGSSVGWKPSYGVYFDLATMDNKSFIYFVDLDNSESFEDTDCTGECLSKISITKDNYISSLDVFYQNGMSLQVSDVTISFSRPNSGAMITSSQIIPPLISPISYIQVTVTSPKLQTTKIKTYSSGRIQIN